MVWPSYSDFTAFCSVGEFGGNFKIVSKHPDFDYVLAIFLHFAPFKSRHLNHKKRKVFCLPFFVVIYE